MASIHPSNITGLNVLTFLLFLHAPLLSRANIIFGVSRLLLVASLLLVAMPFTPSSILAPVHQSLKV